MVSIQESKALRREGASALGTRSGVAEKVKLEEGVRAGQGWDLTQGQRRMWERRSGGCDLPATPFILHLSFIHSTNTNEAPTLRQPLGDSDPGPQGA